MQQAETLYTHKLERFIFPTWWKEAVFYQVYPRSFRDTDGDGIGDLWGIIEKLGYLNALGVDALYINPHYDSPNVDDGYDVRDYYQIMREFGTMDDIDESVAEFNKLGMRLMIDVVINHTSDQHKWFVRKQQPDLNWDNERVRADLYAMLQFWLEKGVSGLRFDAVATYCKIPSFLDLTHEQLANCPEAYTEGPNIHKYLREMHHLSRFDTISTL